MRTIFIILLLLLAGFIIGLFVGIIWGHPILINLSSKCNYATNIINGEKVLCVVQNATGV